MIFKRAVAKLRAQDWMAIVIELGIVILGVFIGNWVNDWNQSRVEKQEISRLLTQLRPEVSRLERIAGSMRDYYGVTDRFAHVALAGWKGNPAVSDKDFVIAAYQASQVNWIPDAKSLSELLGGDQVRKIDDPDLRIAVIRLLNYDFEPLSGTAMRTRYRDDVREVVPQPIQEAIRARCGDQTPDGKLTRLPARCEIPLARNDVASGAAALRARPELAGELRQHQAAVAAFLTNLGLLEARLQDVDRLNRQASP